MTKIKKVIATGQVERACSGYINYTEPWTPGDIPDGTPVEIVALVEPRRKLVRPDGAVWVRDMTNRGTKLLIGTDLVAMVWSHGDMWKWRERSAYGIDYTNPNAATIACEEHLADAGIHGFGWEPASPEFIGYRVDRLDLNGNYYAFSWLHDKRAEANDAFCFHRHSGISKTVWFYGVTADGYPHELDRWERGESDG